jgi:hypothetical protein
LSKEEVLHQYFLVALIGEGIKRGYLVADAAGIARELLTGPHRIDSSWFQSIREQVIRLGITKGFLQDGASARDEPGPLYEIAVQFGRAGTDHEVPLSKKTEYQVLCGGKFAPFHSPWDESELHALQRELSDPFKPPTLDRLRQIGNELRDAIEEDAGGFTRALEQARTLANKDGGQVQIRFVIQYAELAMIPWELITEPDNGGHRFLVEARIPPHSVVRESPVTGCEGREQTLSLPIDNVLFAYATGGDTSLPIQRHEKALKESIGTEAERMLHVLPVTCPEDLEGKIEESHPFDIVHILAHGRKVSGAGGMKNWGVCLDDGTGVRPIRSGEQLGELLTRGGTAPSLVVLAVCNSGHPGDVSNEMGSMAQALQYYGVRAVIGSQFPLNKDDSVIMTEQLYKSLFERGLPLSEAAQSVRGRLFHQKWHSWASLTLYSRYPQDVRFVLQGQG